MHFGDFSPAVTIPPLDNGEQELRIVYTPNQAFLHFGVNINEQKQAYSLMITFEIINLALSLCASLSIFAFIDPFLHTILIKC